MTKVKILLLFLPIAFNAMAQKDSINVFEIQYERALTPEKLATTFHSSYLLQIFVEPNISVFNKISVSENAGELVKDKDDEATFYYTPQGKNITTIYKDYSSNKLFSKQDIADKYFIIEDSLSIFDWQIFEDTKDILGYACQLAKTNFRGRTYKAWFTSDLPVGGPWKYDGLPGMILLLKTETEFITYEAVSITTKKIKPIKIENPLNDDKSISWLDFKKIYKKTAISLSKYNTGLNIDGGIILQRTGIERYIEDDDMEYVADKEFEKQQQGQN